MADSKKSSDAKVSMENVISLCKRRGFVYPGSEIYGGLANTWDYGPYGVQLKKNILDHWWKTFVENRDDILGLDAAILMNPRVWEASGHVDNFSDPMMDCKKCKERFRGDKLIEEATGEVADGKTFDEIYRLVMDNEIACPACKACDWTEPRSFNLMFKTYQGVVEDTAAQVYLRPETAQGIFANFKNILDSTRVKLPFAVAQYGKAFRNEITPGNFTFRTREFEQLEIEHFMREEDVPAVFDKWVQDTKDWFAAIGVKPDKMRVREHDADELSHYSTKTVDVEYEFPFGWGELQGIAHRGTYDLDQHIKHSGQKLQYRDPYTNEVFVPHVVEPSWGLTRTLLVVLLDAYEEQKLEGGEVRTVMHFAPAVAPVQVAVMPLHKKLNDDARKLYADLKPYFRAEYDSGGAIGKLYRRQDEIGTPFCVTFDFDSLEDGAVTVRDRDSMTQERVKIEDLKGWLFDRF
jgi:glycyl-tRNA synthetase